MRPLLILRPEPGGSASAERARSLGIEPLVMPLFEVRTLPWAAPGPANFDAILMTSANAARHGGPELDKLRMLPVYAVGETTADAARGAGFTIAGVGGGGLGELALPKGIRLLHLAGRHRRSRVQATVVAVYESAELPPPEGLSRVGKAVAAIHSPRAGRRLAALVEHRSAIAIAAISAAAAEASGAGWDRVEVAEAPNDSSLLALAARLCNIR